MEFLKLESAIRKIALTLYLGRWQSRAPVCRKLTPEERQCFLRATEEIYGRGEAEELEDLLTMRRP